MVRLELIETLWNVNNYGGTRDYIDTTRINRNIVECKYYESVKFTSFGDSELIETLWNVNDGKRGKGKKYYYELIETLWNVNVDTGALRNSITHRINRNIVECKCDKNGLGIASGTELIETLWNVNFLNGALLLIPLVN